MATATETTSKYVLNALPGQDGPATDIVTLQLSQEGATALANAINLSLQQGCGDFAIDIHGAMTWIDTNEAG